MQTGMYSGSNDSIRGSFNWLHGILQHQLH
jgi:hypothetical protein